MSLLSQCLAFVSMPGGSEWLIIGIIGLLLFGNRLPEVSRSLGRSVLEFKKGLSSMEEDIKRSIQDESSDTSSLPGRSPETNVSAGPKELEAKTDSDDMPSGHDSES